MVLPLAVLTWGIYSLLYPLGVSESLTHTATSFIPVQLEGREEPAEGE